MLKSTPEALKKFKFSKKVLNPIKYFALFVYYIVIPFL
jgi:hypothetical protein